MKNELKTILYLFLSMTLITVSCQKAFAVETVRAQEVLTKQDKIDIENRKKEEHVIYRSKYNILGERDSNVEEGRPEMHFRNWGDIIKEKRIKRAIKQGKTIEEIEAADNNKAVSEKQEEISSNADGEVKASSNVNKKPEKKQVKNDDITINCDEMEYFENTGELETRGRVEIITKEGAKAYSDKAIYNRDSNTIKLFDNVVLLKGATTTNGEYMLIDLNEENALMDEPVTHLNSMTINAKEGYAYADKIEDLNGNIEINKRVEMEFYTRGFSSYGRAISDARNMDFDLKKNRSKPYKFKTKQILIRAERDHDSMIMKNVDIYYGKKKILNVPSIEMFQDKEMTYSELNFPPELGSIRGFGAYAGLGYTFKLPKTFTLRTTPALVYDDGEFGLGGIVQLKSRKTFSEVAYASNSQDLIYNGQYRLNDRFRLEVGRHVYKNEWLSGGNRAGYIAELDYDDTYNVRELGGATFRHVASAGWVADYKSKKQEKDMNSGFRYRYQAQLSKNLWSLENKEQDIGVYFGAIGQAMATLYSDTGDTFALFKFGPTLSTKVKRWNSNIMYTMGGIHGKSPYYFDEYRYGKHTINFDESLVLNKYLSVGYRGAITPLKDNLEKELLTENRVYAIVGPEDFKLAFSYDAVRSNMYFDFLFLLGSDNLDIKYDKLTIQDPSKIRRRTKKQSDKELNKIKVPEEL